MKNGILKEQDYQEQMEHVVEPYLHSKERELWLEREHETDLCKVLSGKEGERSCFNLAWIYGDEREVQGVDLLFSERRISCVYTGALWAWTQLSSGGGSVACTCGFLQAVCGRSFICGKDSEKRA